MIDVPRTTNRRIVARGNNGRATLRRLLTDGRSLIASMVGHSIGIQKDSAKLLMIGVQMLEITVGREAGRNLLNTPTPKTSAQ